MRIQQLSEIRSAYPGGYRSSLCDRGERSKSMSCDSVMPPSGLGWKRHFSFLHGLKLQELAANCLYRTTPWWKSKHCLDDCYSNHISLVHNVVAACDALGLLFMQAIFGCSDCCFCCYHGLGNMLGCFKGCLVFQCTTNEMAANVFARLVIRRCGIDCVW